MLQIPDTATEMTEAVLGFLCRARWREMKYYGGEGVAVTDGVAELTKFNWILNSYC
jgi:hypothetical protein